MRTGGRENPAALSRPTDVPHSLLQCYSVHTVLHWPFSREPRDLRAGSPEPTFSRSDNRAPEMALRAPTWPTHPNSSIIAQNEEVA
ncbi:hypothetical protein VTH06DRAFT_1627 [Thermothelomyces fergusii]